MEIINYLLLSPNVGSLPLPFGVSLMSICFQHKQLLLQSTLLSGMIWKLVLQVMRHLGEPQNCWKSHDQLVLPAPRYFKKGIAFNHKLSYSHYLGFCWPVVMSWDFVSAKYSCITPKFVYHIDSECFLTETLSLSPL